MGPSAGVDSRDASGNPAGQDTSSSTQLCSHTLLPTNTFLHPSSPIPGSIHKNPTATNPPA